MPKILENVKERIVEEARKQVESPGYSAMTIRSLAKELKIATGTIYNYFPSKQMIVATFMMEEWQTTMNRIKAECDKAENYRDILSAAYNGILDYCNAHISLFEDKEARVGFADAYPGKKNILISQIAELFEPVCVKKAVNYTPHTSEFLAESLMLWVTGHKDLEELYIITKTLFNENGGLK